MHKEFKKGIPKDGTNPERKTGGQEKVHDCRERERVRGRRSAAKAGAEEADSSIEKVKDGPGKGQGVKQKEERSYVGREDGH